jgi:hypothetical protein
LWDLQAMCLAYLEANDRLTGSDFKRQVMEYYDENRDGVIDYMEKGRGGILPAMLYAGRLNTPEIDPLQALRLRFLTAALSLKLLKKDWNPDGHNFGEKGLMAGALGKAWEMSQSQVESPDPMFPSMTWGKGKWPSLQSVMERQMFNRIYGMAFPARFDVNMAPYGIAFRYSDAKCNGGKFCSSEAMKKNEDIIGKYHGTVAQGAEPLPFTFYVPAGFGKNGKSPIPNARETSDAGMIFCAEFEGKEVWKDLNLAEIP